MSKCNSTKIVKNIAGIHNSDGKSHDFDTQAKDSN